MAITYEEALSTLKSMFGEPWMEETLDAVLRHHEGHMENTVETVLGHGDGDPDELVRRLNDPTAAAVGGSGGAGGDATSGSGSGSGTSTPTHTNASGGGGGSRKLRGIRTELPPDFLVIPGHEPPGGPSGAASTGHVGERQDIDADEQLARMLQDELFTQELANNPEFAHLAGRGGRTGSAAAAGAAAGSYPANRRSATSSAQPQGPNVVDKLGEMGENAKKRLTLFARQFNDRMQNPQPGGGGGGLAARLGGGGGGGGGGGAAASSSTGAERRGLLDLQLGDDDDEDEEVDFLGSSPVEMGSIKKND
mmetsp:Transcript_33340/g.67278  ORF Transcript_33340/g.67278 Transcript_33340/m.67278 type:complete len:308 (-) Transcript_33340:221-1144(-)